MSSLENPLLKNEKIQISSFLYTTEKDFEPVEFPQKIKEVRQINDELAITLELLKTLAEKTGNPNLGLNIEFREYRHNISTQILTTITGLPPEKEVDNLVTHFNVPTIGKELEHYLLVSMIEAGEFLGKLIYAKEKESLPKNDEVKELFQMLKDKTLGDREICDLNENTLKFIMDATINFVSNSLQQSMSNKDALLEIKEKLQNFDESIKNPDKNSKPKL
jgi:hypothetical protein